MIGVFYSKGKFDRKKLEPVKNIRGQNKPRGGLWLTPLGTITFQDWWMQEMGECWGDTRNELDISGKALVIQNNHFLRWLSKHKEYIRAKFFNYLCLDFEALAKDYDYIVFKYNSVTRDIFHGWDLDSILCLNPEKAELISSIPVDTKKMCSA